MTNASTQPVVSLEREDSPSSSAMEYTSVLSIPQLVAIVEQHTDILPTIVPKPLAKVGDEILIAPTTDGGKIIVFKLTDFHEISGKYRTEVLKTHGSTKAVSLPVYITLDEVSAAAFKSFDLLLKRAYRSLDYVTCPMWLSLIKQQPDGSQILPIEVVLENSDALTHLTIFEANGGIVEGEGREFLERQIGSLENLKDYLCCLIAEFSWILFWDAEGVHRVRVKAHSLLLKKKQAESPFKRLRFSSAEVEALKEKCALISLTSLS